MTIQEHVSLAPFTTFQVGGPARYFVRAESEADVLAAYRWAKDRAVPLEVIGGGSNLLVSDAGVDGMVLHLALSGVEQSGEVFEVEGGENWDTLVDRTIEAGCAGMECLAGIPGTVGASPVQNIGAYGQEVAQTVESVRALDRSSGLMVELPREACLFRYRRSLFNTEEPARYVITRVRFRLRPNGTPELSYADLKRYFAGRSATPTLAEIAGAVREIRRGKGMVLIAGDPDTQSAGSYFKNPVVAADRLEAIAAGAQTETVGVPHWAAGAGAVKLSAAWLLERAGFGKGFRLGAAGLSTKHALAITNRGGASCAEILGLEERVRAGVQERFGVRLEREPVFLGSYRAKGVGCPDRGPLALHTDDLRFAQDDSGC